MSIPIYTKIHDALIDEVEKGIWKVGGKLPGERELSERFGVSRLTLRQAVGALCDEGILERRVGSGTFVVGKRVREQMRGTTSFTEIVTSQGKEPLSRVISYVQTQANALEAEKLGVHVGTSIVRMERIRYADGVPICFEVACIPASLIAGFPKQAVQEHFFATLREAGQVIGRSEQTISAKVATAELAGYLEVKTGSAVLSLSQLSFLSDETAFEYVLSSYVGERFEFYLER
ncbi:MAG: GntR family transcriptional regulator [Streptococcaceae bacterium]|jgi:GntR family transcriptional regulator|nr:GntR family transcriptional regulator [Streptococcaceae bacterium]